MNRVIFPDLHGEHLDRAATDAFLTDLKRINPEEIVGLGDIIDCGGIFSSHARSYTEELTESYQDDVAACNWFLDEVQKRAPRARIYLLEGNHEQRVERWAASSFPSAKDARMVLDRFGPERVLHLKDRGIKYYKRSGFYQGISIPGTIRLGKCFFVHGICHSKHAASTHLARFGANVVFGHVHRSQAVIERTVSSDGIGAFCPGTLAKLQPLYRHTAPSDWSHGYAVQYVARSGNFMHVNVPIVKGVSLLP